ncbi:hypothetical protein ACE6H2_006865 [Prunus campanulata]
MVPKANAIYMSLFILLLLFSSKVVFARIFQFSETKEKINTEFSKMKIVNHDSGIDSPGAPSYP